MIEQGEPNPYRESPVESVDAPVERPGRSELAPPPEPPPPVAEPIASSESAPPPPVAASPAVPAGAPPAPRPDGAYGSPNGPRDGGYQERQNGRRGRRNRGRGRRDQAQGPGPGNDRPQGNPAPTQLVATGETTGWFDPSRDGGFVRRSQASYLADAGDAYVSPFLVRQHALRKSDLVAGTTGRDPRGRTALIEITAINGEPPENALRRPEFNTLTATYPERKLYLETGRPAKGGPELIRRAIDLIAPIGYGQRALIVAPARAGKTTLLHAITEGIALNHPEAALLILLVDERPEEVSEAISWGVGEVIASSFDQPAARHVEVTEMVLERARRLVEQGRDVVIVLDSLTRMARAHNTAERGTGRTMSGGLDSQAMAKPKAFFGSARAVASTSGGGSLTIIATALIETGSRMDDVIFEEFKGTGNCEIKLDRSLAEKRIYPAIDIATSGTRREEKLFRPEQLDSVYTLRRGLSQMPPQAGMEWLIKRIANTPNNDQLLSGL
ncbi:MAG: transcription termination factor Rho [Gemmatimonadetes bacterium]|nr:transcription termination factor Rho [Gemmatimonadota bacterium]